MELPEVTKFLKEIEQRKYVLSSKQINVQKHDAFAECAETSFTCEEAHTLRWSFEKLLIDDIFYQLIPQ